MMPKSHSIEFLLVVFESLDEYLSSAFSSKDGTNLSSDNPLMLQGVSQEEREISGADPGASEQLQAEQSARRRR